MHNKPFDLLEQAEVRLDRTYPSSGWHAPASVRLEGGYIVPEWSSGSKLVYPGRGMLSRFAALADEGEPRRFAEYARRWGMLDLCQHGLAVAHAGVVQFPLGGPCMTYFDKTWDHREPIDAWRHYAGQARAIVVAVARWTLLRDEPDVDSWRAFFPELEGVDGPPPFLAAGISMWLKHGAVRPRLAWPLDPDDRREPPLVFDGIGLFGGIALHLLLAAWRGDSITPCREPGCSALADLRGRRKAPYCDEHRLRAIAEARSARFRASHPGYYGKAQRLARAAQPYVTGRPRRSRPDPPTSGRAGDPSPTKGSSPSASRSRTTGCVHPGAT